MKATQTDIAWLAGFLDGEGTIGLHRSNAKSYPHPYLRPHVQAPNTDKRLIDRMAQIVEDITGVTPAIVVSNKGGDGWKKAWRCQLKSQGQIAVFLSVVTPYFVSKRRQAELVHEFCARRNARLKYKWYEFRDIDEAAYLECLSLNRRGTPAEDAKPAAPTLRLVQEA